MKSTGIQWADDTVNPTTGCDGCELWIPGQGGPCYAGNFHEMRLAKSLPNLYDPVFTNVRLVPGRMNKALRCMDLGGTNRPDKPWMDGLRRKIFVGDLGDIFSKDVPFEFLKAEIFDLAVTPFGSRHDQLLLTKQPNRAKLFAEWLHEQGAAWPDNVWLGTSITCQNSFKRVEHLREVPAKHRFLSLEPLVGDPGPMLDKIEGAVDWLIIGGESDQGAHAGRAFDIDWAYRTIDVGRKLEIGVFVKQFGSLAFSAGKRLVLMDSHGGDWDEWPEDLRVREMPFGCL